MTAGPAPVTVRLRRAGRGPAPLRVLLLHGLAGGANVWDDYLGLADHGHELWAAELPWRAEAVPDWPRQSPAHWTAQAMARVPGGPDVVVAHSFGAAALLALLDGQGVPAADLAPAGVDAFTWHGLRGVVLVSPFYRADPGQFDWETISYYLNGFDRILADGLRVRSGGRIVGELRQEMALKVRERIGPYGWTGFFDTYLRTPYLDTRRLAGPCLVIGGADDFAAFPADSEALGAALPDATVKILGDCGHFAMIERAAEFAALTDSFLTAAATRTRPGRGGGRPTPNQHAREQF
ncbi:alpha/beta fold hydrolase [Kitasatospora sp. NPDC056138]|uniref:alpha/beta fold hydrolase n=1 Tax=Kitasatospora sp. NPDC056138 TaxID=3345724 RepID=UPI0035DFA162